MTQVNHFIPSNTSENGKSAKRVFNTAIRLFGIIMLAVAPAFLACAVAQAQNPAPFVANPLIPDTAAPGTNGLTLTVNGSGFISTSVVNWNGTPLATTFVSQSQVKAAVPSADLTAATTAVITVTNANAAASNLVFFSVGAPHSTVGYFRTDIATGTNPVGVAVGDFNRDGIQDLAIATAGSNTVNVYLGKGNGTFSLPTSYPVATNPINVVVGDMNNDGILDIVAVSSSSSHVTILLGNGDGTFKPGKGFVTGGNPQSLELGDFNRDGKLDVATANFSDNTVSVLLGNGDGTLSPKTDYPVGMGPVDVKTADFNGDGFLDLVSVNNTDYTISVLFGNGNGTFQTQTAYSTWPSPNAAGVADVNGDGHPDILVSNAVHAFSVLLNSGTGTFPTYTKYPACPYPAYAVGLADLQNNGQVDMTVTNYSCSLISSSWGNGDGTFQTAPTYFTVGLNPDALAIADFNKDGNLDMVVLNEKAHTASILMQSGLAQPSLSPNGINFGPIQGGFKSAPQTVTITNTTGSALALSKVVLAGANPAQFTESNNCPSSLGSGASCTATVVFAPLAAENFYANLAVVDPVGIQVAAFAGSGRLSFSMVPDAMTFPRTQVGQDSAPQTAVITNESGLLLVFSSITMQGADPADFSQTNNCPVSPSGLGPGQQCTITVEETPQMAGNLFATVVVLSNGSTPRRAIALTGSAYN